MAKPNYSFEKRQRELAKKRKKEEKAAKKAAGGEAAEEMSPDDAAMTLGARHGEAPDAEGDGNGGS